RVIGGGGGLATVAKLRDELSYWIGVQRLRSRVLPSYGWCSCCCSSGNSKPFSAGGSDVAMPALTARPAVNAARPAADEYGAMRKSEGMSVPGAKIVEARALAALAALAAGLSAAFATDIAAPRAVVGGSPAAPPPVLAAYTARERCTPGKR